jgi:hypothetical protein
MPDRPGHPRQRRTPPAIRRPRVPPGQRLVRERGWLTTDHPQARWYRVISHSADWSDVRLQVAASPDADATEVAIIVRPGGLLVPQRTDAQLGAEALRDITPALAQADDWPQQRRGRGALGRGRPAASGTG